MSKRVPKGGMYYHVTYQAGKFRIVNLHDLRGNESNANLSCGNYFLDYSKAAEVADKFHAILKEYCDVEKRISQHEHYRLRFPDPRHSSA